MQKIYTKPELDKIVAEAALADVNQICEWKKRVSDSDGQLFSISNENDLLLVQAHMAAQRQLSELLDNKGRRHVDGK